MEQFIEIKKVNSNQYRLTVTPSRITLKEPHDWANSEEISSKINKWLKNNQLTDITTTYRGSVNRNAIRNNKITIYNGTKQKITINF